MRRPGRSTLVVALTVLTVAGLAASGPLAATAAPSADTPGVEAVDDVSVLAGGPADALPVGDDPALPAGDDPALPGTDATAKAAPDGESTAEAGSRDAATADQQSSLVERFEFRLAPREPDEIEADVTYELPSGADRFSVLEDERDLRVVDADGFEERTGGEWAWDGRTEAPSVTVRIELATSAQERRWVAYGTDEWAIAERPPGLSLAGDVPTTGREVELAVDGEGVAGTDLVYLGEHETHATETEHERIVLVVPDAVTLPDPPGEVVTLLEHASDRLRVGSRPDVYHGFVVPDDVRAGLLGRNLGTDSLYFNRFQLDTADGVWVHEYVHARQDVAALTEETRWLSEGSADYYEPLYVMEQGHVSFEEFRAELQRGRESPFDQVVVSEPDTWQGPAVRYTHGALVTAAIDREIREHSDGEASFQDVLYAWNEADRFDQDAFLDAVEDAGGQEARERARVLTETSTLPETWDYETHQRLFEGTTDPRDGASGTGDGESASDSVSIESVQVASDDDGATVEVVLVGESGGSVAGEYRVESGERTFARGSVVVPGGETRTVTASVPEGVETVAITVGGETRTVEVATDDGLPGFGAVPALVALLATGGGLALRRR